MRRIFFDKLKANNKNHQRIPADGFSCSFPIGEGEKLKWYRFIVRKKISRYDVEFLVSHRAAGKIVEHHLSDEAADNLPKEVKDKFYKCIHIFIYGDDD